MIYALALSFVVFIVVTMEDLHAGQIPLVLITDDLHAEQTSIETKSAVTILIKGPVQ